MLLSQGTLQLMEVGTDLRNLPGAFIRKCEIDFTMRQHSQSVMLSGSVMFSDLVLLGKCTGQRIVAANAALILEAQHISVLSVVCSAGSLLCLCRCCISAATG